MITEVKVETGGNKVEQKSAGDKLAQFLGYFFSGAIMVIVLLVIGNVVDGFVVLQFWGWFAVPLLGLPALSFIPAMGVSLLVGYLTHHVIPDYKGHEVKMSSTLYSIFAYPAVCLAIGWVIHLLLLITAR